jgi:endonuclease/exonuclease/phosphatase family metal-dependent hydrolase
MKSLKLLLVLTLCVEVAFAQTDRRSDKSRLVIATFNAEFLWDGRDPEEGTVDLPYRGNPAEAEAHMADVAMVIRNADADIINMVEIENLDALNILNTKFLVGMNYKAYLVNGTDSQTGQDVGLLTRLDPEGASIIRYPDKGTSGAVTKAVSKNYYAKFTIDGQKIALIGLHFLAGPNRTDRMVERQAQANAITNLARQLVTDGNALIVCGDFNDYDGQTLDHISSQPITTVLSEIKELDPSKTTDNLITVASKVPQNDRYTAFWDKDDDGLIDAPQEFTTIDHILVSPALAIKIIDVNIPHNHDPRFISDHFPVVATFGMSAGTTTPSTSSSFVKMISLLPNPSGDEAQNESITLKNFGTAAADITDWTVRDIAGLTWTFTGSLAANEQKVFKRAGQKMSMNNGGDTIVLIKKGTVKPAQSFTYNTADENEEINITN